MEGGGGALGWTGVPGAGRVLTLTLGFLSVFVEIEPTYHEMNHFKVNSSVVFSTFTVLCNHHLCLVPEHSVTAKGGPIPLSRDSPSPTHQPLATTDLRSVFTDLPVLGGHTHEVTHDGPRGAGCSHWACCRRSPMRQPASASLLFVAGRRPTVDGLHVAHPFPS